MKERKGDTGKCGEERRPRYSVAKISRFLHSGPVGKKWGEGDRGEGKNLDTYYWEKNRTSRETGKT